MPDCASTENKKYVHSNRHLLYGTRILKRINSNLVKIVIMPYIDLLPAYIVFILTFRNTEHIKNAFISFASPPEKR